MIEQPEDSVASAERRRADRRPTEARLRLEVDAQSLEGTTENASDVGVLFFSEESLRVTVEYTVDGETRRCVGRIARCQRMSEDNVGFAVEFDPE